MSFNICFGENHSCSSCCGLHNLDLTQSTKKKWLEHNTANFLALDNLDREKILAFRSAGEKFLEKRTIRKDVYVCPFIGIVDDMRKKTGCLLHKEGSPHPLIRAFPSPQSCSFYGENICQTYNCISKQNNPASLAAEYVVNFPGSGFDFLTYGKLFCNHNLVGVYRELSRMYPDIRIYLLDAITRVLNETEIPVTSFEMPLSFNFYSANDLWEVLGTLYENKGYVFDAFIITPEGRGLGQKLASEIQGLKVS